MMREGQSLFFLWKRRDGLRRRRGFTLVEMIIVLFVMSTIMAMLVWMLRSFSMLQTSTDEARTLAQTYGFARRAALKSGETVYLELDLDEEKYYLYRVDRSQKEPVKTPILDTRSLSSRNSLIAIVSPLGGRITAGKVVLPFYYNGMTEEVSIYLGSDPTVEKTVHFPRFAVSGLIEDGETLPESMPAQDDDKRENDLLQEKEH